MVGRDSVSGHNSEVLHQVVAVLGDIISQRAGIHCIAHAAKAVKMSICTSSLRSLLRRLDKTSDSRKFHYRIELIGLKDTSNGRKQNSKEFVGHLKVEHPPFSSPELSVSFGHVVGETTVKVKTSSPGDEDEHPMAGMSMLI